MCHTSIHPYPDTAEESSSHSVTYKLTKVRQKLPLREHLLCRPAIHPLSVNPFQPEYELMLHQLAVG